MTQPLMQNQCVQCQSLFVCNPQDCWCMDYPACEPIAANSGCLCPSCLRLRVQARIAKIDHLPVHAQAPAQALACQGQPAIDGLDYTVENGLLVFSRWAHLKRGTCCGNGCRHCPYGHAGVATGNAPHQLKP
jgi:hypothetical protein